MVITVYHSLYFVGAFLLVSFLFIRMTPRIIKDKIETPYFTDSAFFKTGKFINVDYLRSAKYSGYEIGNYFRMYLPVDMVYPLIYTGMFLCIFTLVKSSVLHHLLEISAFAGMCFDYLENITLSLFFLSEKDSIAPLSSLATTAKSILWGINLVALLILVIIASIHWIQSGAFEISEIFIQL